MKIISVIPVRKNRSPGNEQTYLVFDFDAFGALLGQKIKLA
jgi:hypothetical protein